MSEERQDDVFTVENIFVYAPLGAALFAKDVVPTLVQTLATRGRQQVEELQTGARNVIGLSKAMGQMRVNQAQDEVRKRTEDIRTQTADRFKVLSGAGAQIVDRATGRAGDNGSAAATVSPAPEPVAEPIPERETTTAPEPVTGREPVPEAAEVAEPATSEPAAERVAPAASPELAIPDYDTLTATQVAQRLNGLDGDALSAIRDHEASNRARKTVLGKIDSLLEG